VHNTPGLFDIVKKDIAACGQSPARVARGCAAHTAAPFRRRPLFALAKPG
jgi:hypothetical protein